MGPFANNPRPPAAPAPDHGSKLPVPDIEGSPQIVVPVFVSPKKADHRAAARKWLAITLGLVGLMVLGGLAWLVAFRMASNTPGALLLAATSNAMESGGLAGDVNFQVKHGSQTARVSGEFAMYADPTNPRQGQVVVSLGDGAARVSARADILAGSSDMQFAGLGGVGQLLGQLGIPSHLPRDQLAMLGALDGQWYLSTPGGVSGFSSALGFGWFLRAGPSSDDIAAMGQLYSAHPFVVVKQQFGDEPIGGVQTMHAQVAIDRAGLADYLRALRSAHLRSVAPTSQDIDAARHAAILDQLRIDVWVARGDRTFRQMRLAMPHDGPALTLAFRPELVTAQRQPISQPTSSRDLAVLAAGLRAVFAPASTR